MKPLWHPGAKRKEESLIYIFQKLIEQKYRQQFKNYQDFHRWSVDYAPDFWRELIEWLNLKVSGDLQVNGDIDSFAQYDWFSAAKVNFAENLLRFGDRDEIALSFIHESGKRKELSYRQLKNEVQKMQSALKKTVSAGDVVACYMPNCPETVITMLATASLGAIFTSTSCDFGVEGVVDRFSQSRPKVLVSVMAYSYGGKKHAMNERLCLITEQLPDLEQLILVNLLEQEIETEDSTFPKYQLWEDYLNGELGALTFKSMNFSDPLYIMYSSGTTGKPKCIVHGHGGTLLQHAKELFLHTDLKAEKTIFYFTTCGWMMWNWLVSSLMTGAKIVLYEGSPGHPSLIDFFGLIERENINIFGTSPKFLKALEQADYQHNYKLASLETILSTGAPLLSEQYDFIYRNIKKDLCVSSISGGTDIIGCFMLGSPSLPVYPGEIQCLGLGMAVESVNEKGEGQIGVEGELVCKKSFPSRPLYFLDDANFEKINKAYFNRYPGWWHHGDFITLTERGGVYVHGRSDTTLNPGGVRIGTSEIYRQVEKIEWIADSLCIGKEKDGDIEILLFVKLKENESLDDKRRKMITQQIRTGCTPRHLPQQIYMVGDIPYTRSGKKMELLITRIFNKKALSTLDAVVNPACLDDFYKLSNFYC